MGFTSAKIVEETLQAKNRLRADALIARLDSGFNHYVKNGWNLTAYTIIDVDLPKESLQYITDEATKNGWRFEYCHLEFGCQYTLSLKNKS